MNSLYYYPVIFIDSKVADYQRLVNSAIPEAEVFVLDFTKDGVIQISETLQAIKGRSEIGSIHSELSQDPVARQKLCRWLEGF